MLAIFAVAYGAVHRYSPPPAEESPELIQVIEPVVPQVEAVKLSEPEEKETEGAD